MAISNQEKTYGKTFILDGFDPLHKVAVKYLSANSFYGEYFNLVLEAKYISNQVRKNGKGVYFGIFYDPAINDVSVHDQESYNKKFDSCLEEHSGIQIPKGKNAEDERYKIEDKLSLEERVNCHFLASRETKQYQESKKQISLQVKDFIDWLKAQGAI